MPPNKSYKNIDIETENKPIAQLKATEISNNGDFSTIQNLLGGINNLKVKLYSGENENYYIFYDNNTPKYYIQEKNIEAIYNTEIGEELEKSKEKEIHEIMLKILLLKIYNQSTQELEKELQILINKENEEKKEQINDIQEEKEELKEEILSPEKIIKESEDILKFYEYIKKQSNIFLRNNVFDNVKYGKAGKETLKNMRKNAKNYIKRIKNKQDLLKNKPDLIDLEKINKDIQRYIDQKDKFIKDRTSATDQELVFSTSPDVHNLKEIKDTQKNLIKNTKYIQEYAKKLRETDMIKIDIKQKTEFVERLQKIANDKIEHIVKDGKVINPFIVNYKEDYIYLCKTYPWIKRFIDYEKTKQNSNKNNPDSPNNNNQDNCNQCGDSLDQKKKINKTDITGKNAGERFLKAYSKGGFGGMIGQGFDELAKVAGWKNNSTEYYQAKKFVSTVGGAIGLFMVAKGIFKLAKKGADSIPGLKKAPVLGAVALFGGAELITRGLTGDHSGIMGNLRGMFLGNDQSKKHADFISNYVDGFEKDKNKIEKDHDKIKNIIGDIPISVLTNTTLPLIDIKGGKVFINYDNLEKYIEDAKNKGNITSDEYNDKIKNLKYFKDNSDQNLSSDILTGLGITNTTLWNPKDQDKTINQLAVNKEGEFTNQLETYLSDNKMRIAGENWEYLENYKKIEDYYIKHNKKESFSDMATKRKNNKRIIEGTAIEQVNQENLSKKIEVTQVIETLGTYKLEEIKTFFSENPSTFDIDKMIDNTDHENKKTLLNDKKIELNKLRDTYKKTPAQILGEGLTELGITTTEISNNPTKKISEYYPQREKNIELENQKEHKKILLQNYEKENFLKHKDNKKIQAIIDNNTLIDATDIISAFTKLDKENPGLFKFDYTKEPYLNSNRDGKISQKTIDNINSLGLKLTAKQRGIMSGIMEITNKNLSKPTQSQKANFKYEKTGNNIAVSVYGHKTKINIDNQQLVGFPVGSNSTNAFKFGLSELLLTPIDIALNIEAYQHSSDLEKPFKKARFSSDITYAKTSLGTKLKNMTKDEIIDLFQGKSRGKIIAMLTTTIIGGRGGFKMGSLLFKNSTILSALTSIAGEIGGSYYIPKIFFDTSILEGIYNMGKNIINGNLSNEQAINYSNFQNTIGTHKTEYMDYLNSIKDTNGKSIRLKTE